MSEGNLNRYNQPQLGWDRGFVFSVIVMGMVVTASNFLVQFPLQMSIGALYLGDLLTLGGFTYPFAFLVTDITNRVYGPAKARRVVQVGFAVAVILSIILATPRIALASGTAFLISQLLDIQIFNSLRNKAWWVSPFTSSMVCSIIDTGLFFTLAFSASMSFLGSHDGFATDIVPLFGLLGPEEPRWVSWALGDLGVKLFMLIVALPIYRFVVQRFRPSFKADEIKS